MPGAVVAAAHPLPPDAPQRHQGAGRRRLDDRVVLAAILYVLHTGCAWSALPPKRLGRHRYVIERTLERVSRFRRLARRYDRKAACFTAFVQLACAVICYRRAIKLDLLTHNNPK